MTDFAIAAYDIKTTPETLYICRASRNTGWFVGHEQIFSGSLVSAKRSLPLVDFGRFKFVLFGSTLPDALRDDLTETLCSPSNDDWLRKMGVVVCQEASDRDKCQSVVLKSFEPTIQREDLILGHGICFQADGPRTGDLRVLSGLDRANSTRLQQQQARFNLANRTRAYHAVILRPGTQSAAS